MIQSTRYNYNSKQHQIISIYLEQNSAILRFFAEAFFNSPDLDHGIKSVHLVYILLARLTHYLETRIPVAKMNVGDLLALAEAGGSFDLFGSKLPAILRKYSIKGRNVGEVYRELVDRYDEKESVAFESICVTEADRDFFGETKVIGYGKFNRAIEYTPSPTQYLTKVTHFSDSKVDAKDLVDCL